MRRVRTAPLIAVLTLALAAPAATAAPISISMVDDAFSPISQTVAQGGSVSWQNVGAAPHTATQDGPLALFNTGRVNSGATSSTVVVNAAGIYPYHCSFHPGMVGTLKVPVKVSPTSGTTATTFTVTVASQAAPSGFVYDVQRRIGTGSWSAYRTGVTSASVTFQAAAAGTYAFRSLLRKASTGAKSKPSPAKTVTVS
jgi:plastocyanin